MIRALALASLAALILLPQSAQAQRGSRFRGPAMTPYGPVTNPASTPEWKQAGGNPMLYQQIMEQKMMQAQQKAMQQEYQAMQKQQQAYDKWIKEQKAKKEKGQPVDPAYQKMLDQEAEAKAAAQAQADKAAAKKSKKDAVKKKAASAKAKADASATKAPSSAKADAK